MPPPPIPTRTGWRMAISGDSRPARFASPDRREISSQAPQPVLPAGDLLYPHAVVSFDHHDLTPCDQALVDQHLDLFRNAAIELHNRAGSEFQNVLHRELGFAE